MDFDFSGPQPLFVQVADQLRAGIASGALPEGEQVPSTTEKNVAQAATQTESKRGETSITEFSFLYSAKNVKP